MKILKKLFEWDVWVNVHWFNGNEGETISSRLGRKIEDENCVPCKLFCRVVLIPLSAILVFFGVQKDLFKHCRQFIQDEFRDK